MFIGDFGWFYLSARNALLDGSLPLVGIAASYTWLHQGPYWTYILMILFWFFNFNPVVPAYFNAIVGTITIYIVYLLGKKMFSKEAGLLSAAFFAASPLVIAHSRMPYHTSPIPFFVSLWLLAFFLWWRGKTAYFPLVIFFLAVLYNFELATQILWIVVLGFLFFSGYKSLSKKILVWSIVAWILPMLPILVYDFQRGFKQTVGFAKLLVIDKPFQITPLDVHATAIFWTTTLQRLVFLPSFSISVVIIVFCIGYFVYRSSKQNNYRFVCIIFLVLLFGLLSNPPSDAYIPMLFPFVALLFGVTFSDSAKRLHIPSASIVVVLSLFVYLNGMYLVKAKYFVATSFHQRIAAAKEIITLSKNKSYVLLGKGKGSEHQSFIANYEYLTWYFGKQPDISNYNQVIYLSEDTGVISALRQ